MCPDCGSTDPQFTTEPVEGGGTVRSWTVVRDAFLPGFAGDVPFVLVDVELDVQPDLRMIGRLVDGPTRRSTSATASPSPSTTLADGVAVPAFALRWRAES